MTPEQKAKEIVDQYYDIEVDYNYDGCPMTMGIGQTNSKKCALITVNECMNAAQWKAHLNEGIPEVETVEYWQDVKHEIEKL